MNWTSFRRQAWLLCLVASLLFTPISAAWARMEASPVLPATSHCADADTPGHPAPHPERPPTCFSHCLASVAVLSVPAWIPVMLPGTVVFPEPSNRRLAHPFEVDLRPPIG